MKRQIGIEYHLRHGIARVQIFLQQGHDFGDLIVKDHPVGGIEHEEVHVREPQHFDVLPDDPFILRHVIAEQRLAPIRAAAPGRVVHIGGGGGRSTYYIRKTI